MWTLLKGKLIDVLKAVAPLVGLVCVLQLAMDFTPWRGRRVASLT